MKKCAMTALVTAAALYGLPAAAADNLVKFENGFGVDPVAGIANGAPVPNTVRGVPPGGRPWALRSLKVTVKQDGTISVHGEGLVLAGSDALGTTGAITQVFATLFCGADAFNSAAVPIDAGGNFEIRGTLGPVPPTPCSSPALLIRNGAGNNAWFAAGTLSTD